MALAQPNYIYEGGSGGGFNSISESVNNSYFYTGGNGNGYLSQELMDNNLLLYKGGNDGGYFSVQNSDVQVNTIYEGGERDGFTLAEKCEDFIWTGAIGSGWLVAGNWNYNLVPDLKRRAIIPFDVTNFPSLNAGIFAIGENPNNGGVRMWQSMDSG